MLVDEGTVYGPVVALGSPGEEFPPYGAARGYFEHGSWQQAVKDLVRDSAEIVLCLDDSEGGLWEINHIADVGAQRKTLFLLHSGLPSETREKLLTGLLQRLGVISQDILKAQKGDAVGLWIDGDCVNVGFSCRLSKFSYLIMLRWFLRSRNA
jgi:hypothetical protein